MTIEKGPEPVAPALSSSPASRFRPLEIPVNLIGFVGLSLYMAWTGRVPADLSLFVMLGAFSIWTETALVERRAQVLSRWFARKVRPDDPLPFVGAIAGVIVGTFVPVAPGPTRGLVFPAAMALGSWLATFASGLDWRRSTLSAILVVYNGTGGAILRTAMTLAVLGNIIRSQGT